MPYKDLRKAKPEIHDINDWRGSPDPNFHGKTLWVGDSIKRIGNTNQSHDLLDLYQKGPLKSLGWDKVCGQCLYFYKDPNLANKRHGRCRAYGYKEVHEELTAEVKQNYTEPDGQLTFGSWPGCPTWTDKGRLLRG